MAKYRDGQPVIGINPEPARNPGVLVPHAPGRQGTCSGHASHQTARYHLTPPGAPTERQASSGLIVGTGTGATGWCRSAWLERHSPIDLPGPSQRRLVWFVREAWPSPVTGTMHTEGALVDHALSVTVESDRLVAFGDGIESDNLALGWGQAVTIGLAEQVLRLAR